MRCSRVLGVGRAGNLLASGMAFLICILLSTWCHVTLVMGLLLLWAGLAGSASCLLLLQAVSLSQAPLLAQRPAGLSCFWLLWQAS